MVSRQRWLGRRWRTVLVVGALLMVTAFGASLLWYRYVYHSFAFWSPPSRISYCDRDYETHGGTMTRAQVEAIPASLPGDAPYPMSSIGRIVPVLGWPLWAKLAPPDRRAQLGIPCTTAIYLQSGPDTYLSYGLLGGP